MSLASAFVVVGVVYALIGMVLGIWMGMNQDFFYAHLHAHINLIGWVSMVLFGLVYRSWGIGARPLAKIHFGVANLGAILFLPGLVLALNDPQDAALAAVGSTVVLLSVVLFLIVFLTNQKNT